MGIVAKARTGKSNISGKPTKPNIPSSKSVKASSKTKGK